MPDSDTDTWLNAGMQGVSLSASSVSRMGAGGTVGAREVASDEKNDGATVLSATIEGAPCWGGGGYMAGG